MNSRATGLLGTDPVCVHSGKQEPTVSQWVDRFEGHAVFGSLEGLKSVLETAEEDCQTSPDSLESHDRLVRVLDYVASVLDAADPLLVPTSALDAMNKSIVAATNEVNKYVADKNVGHLNAANGQLDSTLNQTVYLHVIQTPEDVELARESIATFRRSSSQYLRHLEDDFKANSAAVEALSAKATEIKADVDSQKGRVDAAITGFQQQFSAAQETRNQKFAEAEAERVTAATAEVSSQQEKFDALSNSLKGDVNELLGGFKEDMKAQIEAITAHKDKAAELVRVISMTGMAGGYQNVADSARKRVVLFQWLAGLSMAALIGVAVWVLVDTLRVGFQWESLGGRAFVLVTVGIFAAWAGKQAEKYDETERRNRIFELELASLDPYLKDLPNDDRNQIKKDLALSLFGQANVSKPTSNEVNTTGTSLDLARMTIEAANEVIKKS